MNVNMMIMLLKITIMICHKNLLKDLNILNIFQGILRKRILEIESDLVYKDLLNLRENYSYFLSSLKLRRN